MHGIIHLELEKFIGAGFGQQALEQTKRQAGLGDRVYTAVESYPDEELVRLAGAVVELSGKPLPDLLEAFGEHLVPTYLSVYGNLLRPEWGTLEVVEHTEETIHRVVRRRQAGAAPPRLRVERESDAAVLVHYDSARKMCRVARGIIRGVAHQLGERIDIEETQCMHDGAPECSIRVTRPG